MEEITKFLITTFLLGVTAIVYGIYKIRIRKRLLKQGITTEAVITDLRFDAIEEKEVAYPSINFIDNSGKSISYTSTEGASGWSKNVGDKVKITYDPDNPYSLIFREGTMSLIGYIPLIIGIMFTLASITGYIYFFN